MKGPNRGDIVRHSGAPIADTPGSAGKAPHGPGQLAVGASSCDPMTAHLRTRHVRYLDGLDLARAW